MSSYYETIECRKCGAEIINFRKVKIKRGHVEYFDATCPECGQEHSVLWSSLVNASYPTPEIKVKVTCTCGCHRGEHRKLCTCDCPTR